MSAMADATMLATQETRKNKTELNVTDKRQRKLFLALKGSAVAITITSLTNFLAFGIGACSTFLSVKNFCLTTGWCGFRIDIILSDEASLKVEESG